KAGRHPELQSFGDDVQCGHAAPAGALDETLLFYLKARGIPPKEAEALLIQAFIGEAVEGIEHAGLREALIEAVVAWLAARAARAGQAPRAARGGPCIPQGPTAAMAGRASARVSPSRGCRSPANRWSCSP